MSDRLFEALFARGEVGWALTDRGFIAAMLEVEGALAAAGCRAGIVPAEHVRQIQLLCRVEAINFDAMAQSLAATGTPVVSLVRQLAEWVGPPASAHVHLGATSQDIVDTATMLVARRAIRATLVDLDGAAAAAASLAARHRSTLQVGRTLLQPALPITFGLAAAGWLHGLEEAIERLLWIRDHRLAVQLGGAAGTLASLGDQGFAMIGYLAEELDLAAPLLPWHTERSRIADLAGALGLAAGAIAKPAGDLLLLSQPEVGEVREGGDGRGGSSTLPHKRNPIAMVAASACAARAPGLVGSLLGSMVHEHQRAAGAWHAEWRPLADLLATVGSAAAWLRDALEHLEVDPGRMRTNLDATGGVVMAERVSGALAPALGRATAHRIVSKVCAEVAASGRSFAEVLGARPEVSAHLTHAAIRGLLDPAGYLGSADTFIDRALAAHQAAALARQEDRDAEQASR